MGASNKTTLRSRFVVKTENVTTSYFLTQKRAPSGHGGKTFWRGSAWSSSTSLGRPIQSSCRRTKSKGRVGILKVRSRRDSSHEPTQRGHPRTHKRGVGKGPRSPDPAEKREQLQLEVPLEWNGFWCSISYPPPVGELPLPFLPFYLGSESRCRVQALK